MSDLKSKYSEDVNNSRLNTSGPRVWSQFGNTGDAVATHSSLALGHPKLGKLRDMVLQHFKDKEKEKIATRFGYFHFCAIIYYPSNRDTFLCVNFDHFKSFIHSFIHFNVSNIFGVISENLLGSKTNMIYRGK